MKRLAVLAVFLAACAPATAQLQIQTPAAAADCAQTDTITPVIGIAVETYFNGDTYLDYTGSVKEALKSAGFQVHADFEYPLPDLASILLKGSVSPWKNRVGDTSRRVGKVDLDVQDLASGKVLLTLKQEQPLLVFQAPKAEEFAQQVAKAISGRFCQLP